MDTNEIPIARRDSWNISPLPERKKLIDFKHSYTQREYDKLKLGFIPEEMEDKWFIFMEDDRLYLHRSWTGYCIYEIHLASNGNGYQVAEAWVNRDPTQYQETNDETDVEWVRQLIDHILLKKYSD